MISILKASIQKRLSKYEEDKKFVSAAILDPNSNFQGAWEHFISNIRVMMKTNDQKVEEIVLPPHKINKSTCSLFSFLPKATKRRRHAPG